MFITRQEAIETIESVAGSGIIKSELEDALYEIASVLKCEDEDKLSLWGAEDEAGELFVAVREDLITPEYEQRMKELRDRYKME